MADPFLAEIRIFPFGFAPKGWAFCNGQLMPISQNTALFSLCGTTYGGDGKSTFALPDLQGNAPMFWGQGPGLSLRDIGEIGGSPSVTLVTAEMPLHPHGLRAASDPGDLKIPSPSRSLARSQNANAYKNTTENVVAMSPSATGLSGLSLPHNNMMPYLTMNFCIALQGVFPPRG
jgi:microcystin-dependent protein